MLARLALLPVALPASAAAPDPAFGLIEAKRAADVAHDEAIDAQGFAETRYGYKSQQARDADHIRGSMRPGMDAGWQMARIAPTTLAGVVAVLRFANQFEREGNEWPNTDMVGAEGWHYQLRATMAQAIETIIRKGAV